MAPIKKSIRGLILALMLSLVILAFTSSSSLAVPYLQLDIAGGIYDARTQTILAPGDHFTLYAYMTGLSLTNTTYYLSAALVPRTNDPDQGTFGFNSDYFKIGYNGTSSINTVNLATDIYADYGVPPHFDGSGNALYDLGDLARHEVFETIFKEFKIVFKSSSQINPYDTKERALSGGAIPTSGTGMYYATFDVDTSGLSDGNAIHFDLYTLYNVPGTNDLDVKYFAPFDYDAQSLDPPATQVPDASIMFLLGPGLVGLGLLGRRKLVR
jgi:hypothetical protein